MDVAFVDVETDAVLKLPEADVDVLILVVDVVVLGVVVAFTVAVVGFSSRLACTVGWGLVGRGVDASTGPVRPVAAVLPVAPVAP